jgi:hypothetical protein
MLSLRQADLSASHLGCAKRGSRAAPRAVLTFKSPLDADEGTNTMVKDGMELNRREPGPVRYSFTHEQVEAVGRLVGLLAAGAANLDASVAPSSVEVGNRPSKPFLFAREVR